MNISKRKKYNILSTIAKFSFIFIVTFILVTPVLAVPCTYVDQNDPSQNIPLNCDPDEQPNTTTTNNTQPNTTTTNTGVKINTGIVNPIGGVEDIPQFIETILNFVLIVGVPIVALAIIYSGFLFVTAQGNSEKLTKAKKALLYTLIGAALLLGSYVIASAIGKTVDEIKTEDKANQAK